MTIEERIALAVTKMRLFWALFMLASLVVTVVWLPLWTLLFLVPYGIITYFAALTITITYLSSTIEKKEVGVEEARVRLLALQECLAQPVPPEEMRKLLDKAGLSQIAPIETVSEQIGTLNDRPIYEWVELYDPNTGKQERFVYFGPISDLGAPEIAGKVFANVDGVLYVRDI